MGSETLPNMPEVVWKVIDMQQFGDPSSFCIEIEPADLDGQCHFHFKANGNIIGEWAVYTLCKGCIGWAKEFLKYSRERVSTATDGETASEVFRKTYECVYVKPATISWDETARLRRVHHMDEIGMDSFRDSFSVILVQIRNDSDWLIWRVATSGEILSTILPFGSVDKALIEFVTSTFCERSAQCAPG